MSGLKILFVSGSIGLGHAARDLAIARELRRLDPRVDIVWLAGQRGSTWQRPGRPYGPSRLPTPGDRLADRVAKGYGMNVVTYALRAHRTWKRQQPAQCAEQAAVEPRYLRAGVGAA